MMYLIWQMIFCLILAFLLGFLIGWLWCKFFHRNSPNKLSEEQNQSSLSDGPNQTTAAVEKQHVQELRESQKDLKVKLANCEDQCLQMQKEWEAKLQVCETEKTALQRKVASDTSFQSAVPTTASEMHWETAYQVALHRASQVQEALDQKTDELEALKELQGPDEAPINLFHEPPAHRDNLENISGIGPTLHRMLNQLGIYQFRQISQFSQRDIQWVASNLKAFKSRVTRDNWVEQATKLEAKRQAP